MFKNIKKICIFLICMLAVSSAFAIPAKKTWDIWTAYDAKSKKAIDHHDWQAFLDKYIYKGKNDLNVLAYGIVTLDDRKKLERYIRRLESTPIQNYNRDEQLAYWINLYNATVVELVLRYYPLNSILDIDISDRLFVQGPWENKVLRINQVPVSLSDIRNRILRPIWHDARIHYLLNLASTSSPNLPNRAITARNVYPLMDKAAHDYINSRGIKIQNGRLFATKIYQWFASDFGNSNKALIAHMKQYADPSLDKQLARTGSIANTFFDWKLNG